MKRFGYVLSAVLATLGLSAFAKDENGNSMLTEAQQEQLKEKYGESFLEPFMKDLAEYEAAHGSAEGAITEELTAEYKAQAEADAAALAEARKQIAELEKAKADFEALIAEKENTIVKLKATPEVDGGEKVEGQQIPKTVMKSDMTLRHNKYVDAVFKGAAYSGDSTIDTSELKQEFGKYVSNERLEIFRQLMGQTTSTQYMSTIISDKVEVRATQATINSVLQQFVPYWTPKGKSGFTPLTIRNYKCKINVPIVPSDIMEDVLGWMYDENVRPSDMPVIRYILNNLIFPKLDEEREVALAIGEFVESEVTQDGGTATDANATMDGYLTQLKKWHEATTSKEYAAITWLLDGQQLGTGDTLLANIDAVVDSIKPLYKKQKLTIHADPDIVTLYGRAYRAKYPWLKNEDGEKLKVDFSNLTFAPLEGMRGTGCFFITPKENFKHLQSRDPKATKIWMQEENYMAKIFGEWWEGTGFWLADAIFAYIKPETQAAGGSDNSGSGAAGGSDNSGGAAGGSDNSGGAAAGGSDDNTETEYVYEAVADPTGQNPKTQGWYERSGESEPYTYTLTEDTEPGQDKTYYTRSEAPGL